MTVVRRETVGMRVKQRVGSVEGELQGLELGARRCAAGRPDDPQLWSLLVWADNFYIAAGLGEHALARGRAFAVARRGTAVVVLG